MIQLILVIHVLICLLLVALVLLQQGKGAEMGAGFGSGASSTVFGSQGATPFLMKVTLSLAAFFFVTSLSLNYLTAQRVKVAKAAVLPAAPATVDLPAIPGNGGNEKGAEQPS